MKELLPYLKAHTPKYKGEIWDNARRFRLVGAGYSSMPKEQDGYFDIATANHLRGPLKALADPEVRMVFIIGATQVMKSIAGDIWIVHIVEHESDSILVLFEDDPKAKLYASTRCMDTVKKHPVIRDQIADIVQEVDRHQIQNTQIKFGGSRLLKICGLNDGNVSSLSWRYIWISEAWQHKSDGLLRKAIKRADRFADNCKILIESQAGLADEDLHLESRQAHQVPLTWACPHCGGRQTWECDAEYGKIRTPDFVAIEPANKPEGWIAPKAGSHAGMKFAAPEQPQPDGTTKFLTIEERARTAKWECYHCGTLIADTEATRKQIMASYDQDYRIKGVNGKPTITPKAVCFTLPKEAAWNNSFENGVRVYLAAKEAQQSGNELKLQDWYLQERATFYSPRLSQTRVPVVVESVLDPTIAIPNEKFRKLLVDCQQSKEETQRAGKSMTGHFWWIAEATDKAGNTFMLERGYATSWEELFGYPTQENQEGKSKDGVKNRLKIPTRNVAIDGGNWFDVVKEKAALYRTKEKSLDGSGKMTWATWRVMVGDEGRGARHDDGVWRAYWPPKHYMVDVMDAEGKWMKVLVNVVRWSNFAVKSVLYKLRMGYPGQPKFVACDISRTSPVTQAKEAGEFTYENQMNGFVLGEDAKGKPKFIELHKQQHYPDCSCMGIVLNMMAGVVRGEVGMESAQAQDATAKPEV